MFSRCEIDLDNGDYIYSSQKLVDLPGNKLHKKRNLINQFLALYPDYASLPLQPADLDACLELAEKWCRQRTCQELDFNHETSALKRALRQFRRTGIAGLEDRSGRRAGRLFHLFAAEQQHGRRAL